MTTSAAARCAGPNANPFSVSVPAETGHNPASASSKLVFPPPFSPTNTTHSPGPTESEIPSTTGCEAPGGTTAIPVPRTAPNGEEVTAGSPGDEEPGMASHKAR